MGSEEFSHFFRFFFFRFYSLFRFLFVFLRFFSFFSSLFFVFLRFFPILLEQGQTTEFYWENGEFHSDPVCTDPVRNFPKPLQKRNHLCFSIGLTNSPSKIWSSRPRIDTNQKSREGCGCPKFLAGKVFRQISTLQGKIIHRFSGSTKCYPCQGLGIFRQGKRLLEN